jgi:hypothetical protein
VINFGISGDGTAQELVTLQHYVWKYSPDIILLAFVTGNDIRNNSKTLEQKKLRPFFVFEDNELVLDTSFLNHPEYKWKTSGLWRLRRSVSRHVKLFQLLNKVKRGYAARIRTPEKRKPGEEIGLDSMVYVEPHTHEWREAWEITEALLVKMNDAVKEKQARLVVAILSNSIQVHPDREIRKQFMDTLGIDTLFYPDKRLETFCKSEEIEVLTLAPIFQRYAKEKQELLHGFTNATPGFGHWNERGHRLAGETMARYFCED